MDARPDHSVSSTYTRTHMHTRTLGQTHKSLSVNLMAKRSLSQITNACIFIRTDRDNIQVKKERQREGEREERTWVLLGLRIRALASLTSLWKTFCAQQVIYVLSAYGNNQQPTSNNSNNKRQQQQTPPPFGLVIWYLCCRVARFVNADRQLSVCFMFIGMDLPQRCAFLLTNWLMTDTMEWDKARESCRGLTSQKERGGKLCRQATSWE